MSRVSEEIFAEAQELRVPLPDNVSLTSVEVLQYVWGWTTEQTRTQIQAWREGRSPQVAQVWRRERPGYGPEVTGALWPYLLSFGGDCADGIGAHVVVVDGAKFMEWARTVRRAFVERELMMG